MNDRIENLCQVLESGVYQQATGQLRERTTDEFSDKDGFCCLGVACEIYRKETGKGKWDNVHGFDASQGEPRYNDRSVSNMPWPVMEWFGFAEQNPVFGEKRPSPNIGRLSLAEMNDNGYSFADIAKLIREKF